MSHTSLAQPALRAVDVCGVEQGDPRLDCRVDHGVCALLTFAGGIRPTEVIAAEADSGDDETGVAEWAIVDSSHMFSLSGTSPSQFRAPDTDNRCLKTASGRSDAAATVES